MPWLYPLDYGTWHTSVETGVLNLATGQIALDLSMTTVAILVLVWGRIRRARSISGSLAGEGSGTGIA